MTPFMLISILGALAVRAQNPVVESPVQQGFYPEPDCQDYHWNTYQFYNCFDAWYDTNEYVVNDVYTLMNAVCSNRERVTACMKDAVRSCSNADVIEKVTATSFGFCDGNEVDGVMKNFLKKYAGKALDGSCIGRVVREIRNSTGYHRMADISEFSTTVLGRIFEIKSLYLKDIALFFSMDLTETLLECDGMTRAAVYGIMMATKDVYGVWGVNVYCEFQDMILTTINVSQQTIFENGVTKKKKTLINVFVCLFRDPGWYKLRTFVGDKHYECKANGISNFK